MTPDLTNSKRYKNVQLGKHILLTDLVILQNQEILYTADKTLTPEMANYVMDYVKREWLNITPPEQNFA